MCCEPPLWPLGWGAALIALRGEFQLICDHKVREYADAELAGPRERYAVFIALPPKPGDVEAVGRTTTGPHDILLEVAPFHAHPGVRAYQPQIAAVGVDLYINVHALLQAQVAPDLGAVAPHGRRKAHSPLLLPHRVECVLHELSQGRPGPVPVHARARKQLEDLLRIRSKRGVEVLVPVAVWRDPLLNDLRQRPPVPALSGTDVIALLDYAPAPADLLFDSGDGLQKCCMHECPSRVGLQCRAFASDLESGDGLVLPPLRDG
ncbi:MAG TPA: hypothetical protein QGH10_11950, partial [Armatimonadota bacterium]|nr:hypothetical protein [Armatimonadota bacterium]